MACSPHCGSTLFQLLIIGLTNGMILGLNAVAITLTYRLVRAINFAHGDLFALLTVLVALLVQRMGLLPGQSAFTVLGSLLLTLLVTGGVGALGSMAVERLAFRPFRDRLASGPLLATIGLSFMLYQGALLLRTITNAVIPGEHRSVPGVPEVPRLRLPDLLPTRSLTGSQIVLAGRELIVWGSALAAVALVAWLLARTRAGRALRATSSDALMASLCGISRDEVIWRTFALGGALTGLAAWLHALYYTQPATQYGAQSSLIAFAAAILGGIGNPWGALASSVALSTVSAWSDYWLEARWTPALQLGLLVALLVVRTPPVDAGRLLVTVRAVRSRLRRSFWAALGLIGLGLLVGIGWRSQQSLILRCTLASLTALALAVPLGRGGLLDFSAAASFTLGAYAAGLLAQPFGWFDRHGLAVHQIWLLVPIAAGLASLAGLWHAWLARRLRGEMLAVATIATTLLLPLILTNWSDLTSGPGGISGLPAPQLGGLALRSRLGQIGLGAILILVCGAGVTLLGASRFGRAWAALSDDEEAAASSGVNPYLRGQTLVLGAAIAGAAGALYSASWGYIYPGLAAFRETALVLAAVLLGGTSLAGVVLGSTAIVLYDQVLIPWLGERLPRLNDGSWQALLDVRNINFFIFGLLLYVMVRIKAWTTIAEAAVE